MVNRGWLYGLMVFLAQTCNPYYSANDTRNQYEDGIVFEESEVDEIPEQDFEWEESDEEPIYYMDQTVEEPEQEEEEIFRVVEDMPRFPGCENQGLSKSERKTCSDKKMLDFIYKNIVYPEVAKTNGVEGRVIMKFMVGEDGSISKAQVLRDPGAGCGKEAVRVVNMMPKWRPGIQRGKPVKVWFTLPVSFKLPKEESKSKN